MTETRTKRSNVKPNYAETARNDTVAIVANHLGLGDVHILAEKCWTMNSRVQHNSRDLEILYSEVNFSAIFRKLAKSLAKIPETAKSSMPSTRRTVRITSTSSSPSTSAPQSVQSLRRVLPLQCLR